MASKKIYAVKKGKITGVFETWEECKASVEGYPGAEYKSFTGRTEAEIYLGLRAESGQTADVPEPGRLLAYVDGSYEDSLKKYAFGCVFLLPDGRIFTQYGNGDNEQSLRHRNVTGEMLGAMYAVMTAIKNGFRGVELRYDYEGIEKWVTGEWKSKTELTQKYAAAMREWSQSIEIKFTKVAAHTNVKFNELADKTAKLGLTEGNGMPKVCRIEDMTEWKQCD
ncbi:MAG: ribonuclease H family protein [Lachnospiraceae bacterium]|nr:ribonuclease H family protein [Lachnospiraceae bacterium]